MRIVLVIWSLCKAKGGIERIGTRIANEMAARGHEVCIVCGNHGEKYNTPCYDLYQKIHIEILPKHTEKNFEEIARKFLLNFGADVVCALFSWDMLLIFPKIMYTTGIPFIISEHNNPSIITSERWNHYERLGCLTSADCIHVLTQEYKNKLPSFLQTRTFVLPNPAPTIAQNKSHSSKKILAIGRFKDSHKRFSMLIKAFAILVSDFSDWRLSIAGDGNDIYLYRNLIKELKLEKYVHLEGTVENTDYFYSSGKIMCIPSKYEGFPMVAIEAQSHGLPLIGFANCSGVNEIIKHDVNGLLVEEETSESLAESIATLIKDEHKIAEMSRKSVILNKRYDECKILNEWERKFKEVSQYKNKTQLGKAFCSSIEKTYCKIALVDILYRDSPFNRYYSRDLYVLQKKINKELQKIVVKEIAFKDSSVAQRLILYAYSPFVYMFSDDKKFYNHFRFKTNSYFSYTKHPINVLLKSILNFIGPKIDRQ